MKRLACAALLMAALCFVFSLAAADTLRAHLPVAGGSARIEASEIDGETWLMLPAFASFDTLSLFMDDQEVFLGDAAQGRTAILNQQGEAIAQIGVMKSENLRSMFLFSDDPAHQGREYIDNSEGHKDFTTGSLVMVNPSGLMTHAADIDVLRGRGNLTWTEAKKPYSLKLDARVDLLGIGQPSKKWVLLADAMDVSLIRNIMTLDLARELGLSSTPFAEHVDLYYDGEYRGTYLLCEKIEVDEWGVDELDYDKLLGKLNKRIGIQDLNALPALQGTNRFGSRFGFKDGMAEANLPSSGAYFLEMPAREEEQRCWFSLPSGSTFTVNNPENASSNMMLYISERMAEAHETLRYGGVHPENGRSVEQDFDVDGFARSALLQELSFNPDSYDRSAFFVLPAGETRFEPGPAWDFDLAWHYSVRLSSTEGQDLEKLQGWLGDFYGVEAIWSQMEKIWKEELYPLVQNVLLGDDKGTYMRSIDAYAAHIEASRRMNELLWDPQGISRFVNGRTYEEEIALLKSFVAERALWLDEQFAIREVDPEKVEIRILTEYMTFYIQPEIEAYPWSRAKVVDYVLSPVSEATEADYAVWKAELLVQPAMGHKFVSPSVTVNGSAAETEILEDGNLRVTAYLQDLSYRPADYYGEDMGMVFDPDYYARCYPEIAEECGYDPELLLEYFCDEGIYEAHKGNPFFDPQEILRFNPYLEEVLGEDWWLYYTEFIAYGYEEGWLTKGRRFLPTVTEEP